MDSECHRILSSLSLKNLFLLRLDQLENQELLSLKTHRTRAEYCWTLTPWSIQWVLEADPTASRVTYLDADIFLLQSPFSLFKDLDHSAKSFLITDHGYSPEYDQTAIYGRYCVQFVAVCRGTGETILHWWRDRCLEWCSARSENGKFGDQKYFEEISSLFAQDVLALHADARFLAPWNASSFRYSDAVLFHFHGFRIINSALYVLSESYYLPVPLRRYVYSPYAAFILSLPSLYPESGLVLQPQISLSYKHYFKYILAFSLLPFHLLRLKFPRVYLYPFGVGL